MQRSDGPVGGGGRSREELLAHVYRRGRALRRRRRLAGLSLGIVGVLLAAGLAYAALPGRESVTSIAPSPGTAEGGRIAFIRYPGGRDQTILYAMRPDGTGIRRLTHDELASDASPSWSLDGSRIALLADRHAVGNTADDYAAYSRDVYILQTAMGSLERVIRAEDALLERVDWSPDGRWLVYGRSAVGCSQAPADCVRDRTQPPDLVVAPADGSGAPRALTTNQARDMEPAWSPDGQRIAFASDRDHDTETYEVYVVRPDGTDFRRLTSDGGRSPAWSPDGSRIAFVRRNRLYLMDADGGSVRPVSAVEDLDIASPTWSPDGSRLAFSAMEKGRAWRSWIGVLDLESAEVRRLTDEDSEDSFSSPDWGPSPASP